MKEATTRCIYSSSSDTNKSTSHSNKSTYKRSNCSKCMRTGVAARVKEGSRSSTGSMQGKGHSEWKSKTVAGLAATGLSWAAKACRLQEHLLRPPASKAGNAGVEVARLKHQKLFQLFHDEGRLITHDNLHRKRAQIFPSAPSSLTVLTGGKTPSPPPSRRRHKRRNFCRKDEGGRLCSEKEVRMKKKKTATNRSGPAAFHSEFLIDR